MKRITIFFTIMIICIMPMTVSAAGETYSTAGDLYQAWCDNLPDYICGVWSTDGGQNNLTFGIQENEAGDAGKQEILNLVENDSTVSFVNQKHSRNYLLQVLEDMIEYFEKDQGIITAGLNEQQNYVEIGICGIYKDNDETDIIIDDLNTRYAAMIDTPIIITKSRIKIHINIFVFILFLMLIAPFLQLTKNPRREITIVILPREEFIVMSKLLNFYENSVD